MSLRTEMTMRMMTTHCWNLSLRISIHYLSLSLKTDLMSLSLKND